VAIELQRIERTPTNKESDTGPLENHNLNAKFVPVAGGAGQGQGQIYML
jgi:hypothetical protein